LITVTTITPGPTVKIAAENQVAAQPARKSRKQTQKQATR